MKDTYKLILLVDDNMLSNFFNKIILKKSGLVDNVIAVENSAEALQFVSPKKTLKPVPDIIFLNIKTPLMNGWEFLEKYEQLDNKKKNSIVILLNEDLLLEEQLKLDQYPFVKAFTKNKLTPNFLSRFNNQLKENSQLQLIS